MITVSGTAAKQIQHLLKTDNIGEKACLRVSVKEGGCSGFSYKLDFDTAQGESDKILESNGIRILVDSKSLLYLMGMTLNFDGGLNGKGFTFSNPNASKTCGCGFSFNI